MASVFRMGAKRWRQPMLRARRRVRIRSRDWRSRIAKPAYRRLLVAEPALRRAVPLLIITFLLTMAVGTGVQILDHRRQTLAAATDEIEMLADILAARLDGATAGTREPEARPRVARRTSSRPRSSDTARAARVLVSDAEGTVVVAEPGASRGRTAADRRARPRSAAHHASGPAPAPWRRRCRTAPPRS